MFSKAIVAFSLLFAAVSFAQDAFTAPSGVPSTTNTANSALGSYTLTGAYVRVGVNALGTLGSIGATLPGMEFDSTGQGLTNPHWPTCASNCGDYLTPGSPFEGFSVQFTNSSNASVFNTNNNTGASSITGTLYNLSGVAWNGTTYDQRGVWISTSNPNYNITNDAHFNNSWQYIDITTTLKAKVNMTNLYFGRFMDPDAMPRTDLGDTSVTNNSVGFSPIPTTNVVFGTATGSGYTVGLFSAAAGNPTTLASGVTCSAYAPCVGAGISSGWSTYGSVYYGYTTPSTVSGVVVRGDYTIGMGFYVPSLTAGSTVAFNYAYVFGPTTLLAGDTVVNSGAGGGTPGVIPGCTTSCTMAGVVTTPAPVTVVSSAAGTPIVATSSSIGATVVSSTSVPSTVAVVNNPHSTTTTNYNNVTTVFTTPLTTTTTTTPVTVNTMSDGTTQTVNGTAVTTSVVTNSVVTENVTIPVAASTAFLAYADSNTIGSVNNLASSLDINRNGSSTGIYGLLDPLSVAQTDIALHKLASTYTPTAVTQSAFENLQYSADPLSRVDIIDGRLKAKPTSTLSQVDDKNFFWISGGAGRNRLNGTDSVSGSTSNQNIGFEHIIGNNVLIGWQGNQTNTNNSTNVDGTSGTTTKNSVGIYGLYTQNNWIGKLDIGYSNNNYYQTRNISEVNAMNQGSAKGNSYYTDASVYSPEIAKNTRLSFGYRQNTENQVGFTETGTPQTAITFNDVHQNTYTRYVGYRYDYVPNRTGWFFSNEIQIMHVENPAVAQTAVVGGAPFTTQGNINTATGYNVTTQTGFNVKNSGRIQLEVKATKIGDYSSVSGALVGSILF